MRPPDDVSSDGSVLIWEVSTLGIVVDHDGITLVTGVNPELTPATAKDLAESLLDIVQKCELESNHDERDG